MVTARNTGHRCPQCNAAHTWVVDECEVCGYAAEAVAVWRREEARKQRSDGYFFGWSWWDLLHLPDIVELCAFVGRIVIMIARGMVSVLKS